MIGSSCSAALGVLLLSLLQAGASLIQNEEPFHMPPATGHRSDRWRPYIIKKCYQNLPKEYAPCIVKDQPNVEAAEEVVYPSFKMHLPLFAKAQHKQAYTQVIRDRGHMHDDIAAHTNRHGRSFVFGSTSWKGQPPPNVWDKRTCMANFPQETSADSSAGAWAETKPAAGQQYDADFAVFAAVPDNFAFQHWMDRVLILLTQAEHLIPPNASFIARIPTHSFTRELWDLWQPGADKRLLEPRPGISARHMVYACETPLLHPYTVQRSSERLLKAVGLDPSNLPPYNSRKTVLLLSRKDGSAKNGGRNINNMDELINATETVLRARNQGEVLRVWRLNEFKTMRDVIRFWATEVRLVIGSHGGAFYNGRWAPRDTAFLELMPLDESGTRSCTGALFWEMASLMEQPYWSFPVKRADAMWNVQVPIKEYTEVLMSVLGHQFPPDWSPIQYFYQGHKWWRRAQLRL